MLLYIIKVIIYFVICTKFLRIQESFTVNKRDLKLLLHKCYVIKRYTKFFLYKNNTVKTNPKFGIQVVIIEFVK